jgi:hypothetical protein
MIEIKKKINQKKNIKTKSTRVNLPRLDHEFRITQYKANQKINYKAQFSISPQLKDEIERKKPIKKGKQNLI